VDAVAELLLELGSIHENTVAVLLSGPACVGVTTKTTVALPLAGRAKEQWTVLVPAKQPWLGVTETRFTLAGKLSFISTPASLPMPNMGPTDTVTV
jgi:hypothetical protein